MKNSVQLKEERESLVSKLEEIKDLATTEERDLSDDENTKVDEVLASVKETDTKIERAQAIESQLKRAAAVSGQTSTPEVRESSKLSGSFSLSKAITQYASGNLDGIERELHQEESRKNPAFSGLAVPMSVMGEKRTNPQLVSNADELISTETFDWMETLQANLVMGDLCTWLTGLSSNVQLPVLSGTTAGWGTEVAAAPDAATAVGGLTLVPHKLGSYMDISKMLLAQTSGNMESIIRDDMTNAVSAALEAAILSDSDGTGASPIGAFDAAGQSGSGGAATYASILQMEADIATNNAMGTCYITSPTGKQTLQTTAGDPSAGAVGIWSINNTIGGIEARQTSNISDVCTAGGAATSGGAESGILLGQWRDLVIGQFGTALDVVVDPYSQSINGEIRIVINSFWDTAFRRANSFCRDSMS